MGALRVVLHYGIVLGFRTGPDTVIGFIGDFFYLLLLILLLVIISLILLTIIYVVVIIRFFGYDFSDLKSTVLLVLIGVG